ncbi:hypothetical protein Prudu_016602 [Prunus dulcis]|uniref:Uncharacterized protein n=1 Tax=Prunus dulcis TaxID=3755 RepID=A0A4Y1RLN4_PRUDU|nr:hypothetical protein Prudu_016602 [Prunus dulcis]
MSNLIRSHKAVTTVLSSSPLTTPSAATIPAQMDNMLVGPGVSYTPASSESSVAQPVSARRRHRPPTQSTQHRQTVLVHRAKKNTRGPWRQLQTAKVTRVTNSCINIRYDKRHWVAPIAELHSSLAQDIGHVVRTYCLMKWKSWKVMLDEMMTGVHGQLSTNYNLENLDDESLAYVNKLFAERYKQWKSDLHHHFQAFDDPQAALQESCPKELEGLEDRGLKFPEIDVFGNVYVQPGNELAESLHVRDDDGEEPVGSSGVHLPTSSQYSAQVCGSSTRCGVSDPDGDLGSDSREEARDILSRDRECSAAGTKTPFIVIVKRGDCSDSNGGRA